MVVISYTKIEIETTSDYNIGSNLEFSGIESSNIYDAEDLG